MQVVPFLPTSLGLPGALQINLMLEVIEPVWIKKQSEGAMRKESSKIVTFFLLGMFTFNLIFTEFNLTAEGSRVCHIPPGDW